VDENYSIGANDLIDGKYVLLQRGKKNYFIVEVMA
jgi:tyrosyl-tRNA synthetase